MTSAMLAAIWTHETDRFKYELSEWLATFGDRALLSFDHSFFEGWTEEMSDLHDDVTGAFKRRHEQMVPQLNSAIDLAVNLPGPTDSQLLEIVSTLGRIANWVFDAAMDHTLFDGAFLRSAHIDRALTFCNVSARAGACEGGAGGAR